jgi:hypothetical protein
MKLTPDVVSELAKLRSNIKAMQKDEKELTDKLKEQMEKEELEAYAPKSSPYKLLYSEAPRSSVKWKEEWIKLAKDKFGKAWKRTMAKMQRDSETDVVSLLVEPNENYVEVK